MTGRSGANSGVWLMGAGALLGLIVSIYNYFAPVSFLAPLASISHTGGALLVIVSTALLLLAAIILGYGRGRRWVLGFFTAAALLDILGTAFAAYMLDSTVLVGLMAVCLAGWLWHFFGHARTEAVAP